jgi:hypothetical protein
MRSSSRSFPSAPESKNLNFKEHLTNFVSLKRLCRKRSSRLFCYLSLSESSSIVRQPQEEALSLEFALQGIERKQHSPLPFTLSTTLLVTKSTSALHIVPVALFPFLVSIFPVT